MDGFRGSLSGRLNKPFSSCPQVWKNIIYQPWSKSPGSRQHGGLNWPRFHLQLMCSCLSPCVGGFAHLRMCFVNSDTPLNLSSVHWISILLSQGSHCQAPAVHLRVTESQVWLELSSQVGTWETTLPPANRWVRDPPLTSPTSQQHWVILPIKLSLNNERKTPREKIFCFQNYSAKIGTHLSRQYTNYHLWS